MTQNRCSLRDFAVGLAALAVLVILVGPALGGRVRSLSRRELCTANLKGLATSCKIYANENSEKWPMPAFNRLLVDHGGIDYLNNRGTTTGAPTDPGEVGFDRLMESTSLTQQNPTGGSTAVSVTRSLWLLVRSGDARADQFICPSTRDVVDPGDVLFDYNTYDFAAYNNISYGYQVPFGPRDTQPREGVDNRQVLMADKGPYYTDRLEPTFTTRRGQLITVSDNPRHWRPYNSPNHGGQGQSVLRADGSSFFAPTPLAGVNGDNIYTLMTDGWDETGFNRIHGQSPHYASITNPYPGQHAMGPDSFSYSTTDSLIYP